MELKEIKQKVKTVKNIRELTSALETLSALKMKKAQKRAVLSEPFAKKVAHILALLEEKKEDIESPFFHKQTGNTHLLLVVSSDRGFCGSFNASVFRFAEKKIEEIQKEEEVEIFPIGKKAISYFSKKGYASRYSFSGVGDFAELEETKPISDFLSKGFLEGTFSRVSLIYMDFLSTFSHAPSYIQLLPLEKESYHAFLSAQQGRMGHKETDAEESREFLTEPSLSMLVQEIVPQLLEYVIYQSILESNASEHSARMVAMKNASESADTKLGGLVLEYNKARQAHITREVSEIAAAKEAME